ncbi:cytochrome o ubiquinol oxidase subunit IV [Candidatus Saccharibacteria bacterium]|nr:cytochrome o ubiquinol oxidase subunit IV [Candidatus Saccharibacteria bacterium]
MSKRETALQASEGQARGTTASYVGGFILSLILTLTAYFVVVHHNQGLNQRFSSRFILVAIFALAITQLLVQLLFFLHLDRESSPRWNLMVAGFAATVVLILVVGSIWIMNNLNYHMESPVQLDKSIIQDEGVHQ